MNRKTIVGIVFLLLLYIAFTVPVGGQSDGIIVTDADSSLDLSLSISVTLSDYLENLLPRFVINNADSLWFTSIISLPVLLQTKLEEVADRIIVRNADSNQIILLAYPVSLVGDNEPPVLSETLIEHVGVDSVRVRWSTNEFANSKVEVGTLPGVYTMTFSEILYVKEHSVLVTGLIPGIKYYYRITSIDLSGNITLSDEFSLIQVRKVFLPLVLRH